MQNKEKQQVWCKPLRSFLKFFAHVQEIRQPDRQKQHSKCRSVNQLTNNVHLATSSEQLICFFGLVGLHKQLCTFHTLINLLIPKLFYNYARYQMIDEARQCAALCHDQCHGLWLVYAVTCHQHGTEVQTSQSEAIRSIKACS